MARFAQHTRLTAAPGKRDELVAKFLEAVEIQQGNPACEVMFVSTTPDDADAVFLTEVWTRAEEHERARTSPEIQAWSESMPELVAGPPDTTPLEVAGGVGLR